MSRSPIFILLHFLSKFKHLFLKPIIICNPFFIEQYETFVKFAQEQIQSQQSRTAEPSCKFAVMFLWEIVRVRIIFHFYADFLADFHNVTVLRVSPSFLLCAWLMLIEPLIYEYQLIDWLIDWFDRSIDWLIDWLVVRSSDWLIDWLVDWDKVTYLFLTMRVLSFPPRFFLIPGWKTVCIILTDSRTLSCMSFTWMGYAFLDFLQRVCFFRCHFGTNCFWCPASCTCFYPLIFTPP